MLKRDQIGITILPLGNRQTLSRPEASWLHLIPTPNLGDSSSDLIMPKPVFLIHNLAGVAQQPCSCSRGRDNYTDNIWINKYTSSNPLLALSAPQIGQS
jgi:hypothetical protein